MTPIFCLENGGLLARNDGGGVVRRLTPPRVLPDVVPGSVAEQFLLSALHGAFVLGRECQQEDTRRVLGL